MSDIIEVLEAADLTAGVLRRSMAAFQALARAEAAAHGSTPEKIHFHEVGAVDAIIDIVGVATAIEELGPARIVCSSLPMGRGTVTCEHGILPLPAPAVATLIVGVPVYDAGIEGETVTPTGAALLTTLADEFGPMPAMTVEAVGIGGGSREVPGRPNILRCFLGEATETTARRDDEHLVIETNVDDMDPRQLPVLIESLLGAGAMDAYLTPIIMKKGRPGHLVSALCRRESLDALISVLYRDSTTLGCRLWSVAKDHLERRSQTVATPWGPVSVKLALAGDRVLRRSPEFEDCLAIARDRGVGVAEVLALASRLAASEDPDE